MKFTQRCLKSGFFFVGYLYSISAISSVGRCYTLVVNSELKYRRAWGNWIDLLIPRIEEKAVWQTTQFQIALVDLGE